MKYPLRVWPTVLYWRLLKRSKIFKLWYVEFLTELMFKLELFDIEGDEITQYYKNKLKRAKSL